MQIDCTIIYTHMRCDKSRIGQSVPLFQKMTRIFFTTELPKNTFFTQQVLRWLSEKKQQ